VSDDDRYSLREETEQFRALETALTAEKVRLGAMNTACKVALARIAHLEATLTARNKQIAVLWDVLARNERMFALANEAMAALAREAT
jgi:uncharacterized coiled-coil protein SlyX